MSRVIGLAIVVLVVVGFLTYGIARPVAEPQQWEYKVVEIPQQYTCELLQSELDKLPDWELVLWSPGSGYRDMATCIVLRKPK